MDPQNDVTSTYAVPALSKSEMDLRDRYVQEYVVDYDAYAACIRLGYQPAYAKEFCVRFMNEPYVLNKLKQQETIGDEQDDETTQKRKIVSALWREANNKGAGSSQAARVAALSKLSAFYGMDAAIRTKTELTGKDGKPLGEGVFVVPGLATAAEWAAEAEQQQEELVRPTVVKPELKIA